MANAVKIFKQSASREVFHNQVYGAVALVKRSVKFHDVRMLDSLH
jgi:hypothetical protein